MIFSCVGGFADHAIDYIEKNGLVTGGPYESKIGCQPYNIEPGPRPWNMKTEACSDKCVSSGINYKNGEFSEIY